MRQEHYPQSPDKWLGLNKKVTHKNSPSEELSISNLPCVGDPDRMWPLHCVGDSVPMQHGCDGVECGVPGGQLHASLLPHVQAQTCESSPPKTHHLSSHFTFSPLWCSYSDWNTELDIGLSLCVCVLFICWGSGFQVFLTVAGRKQHYLQGSLLFMVMRCRFLSWLPKGILYK